MTGVTGMFDFAQTFADMGAASLAVKRAHRVHKAQKTQQVPCSPVVKVMPAPSPLVRPAPTIPAAGPNRGENVQSSVDITQLVPIPDILANSVRARVVSDMYNKAGAKLEKTSLQDKHTPFALCAEMYEAAEVLANMQILPEMKFLVISSIEFIVVLIDVYKVPKENIFFLDEGRKDGDNTKPTLKKIFLSRSEFGFSPSQFVDLEYDSMKKFDFIIGNPPYQEKKEGNKKANSTLWQNIILHVAKCAAKPGTVMMMIHPAGWRGGGKYKKVRELYNSWDMVYLNINNLETGMKVFNATTKFDWYVAVNRPYGGHTEICDENNYSTTVDLRQYEIIPSDFQCDINKWIGGDEKCDYGYSASWYHCQREHMSPKQDNHFKFPCVRNVGADGLPSKFWYSNVNKGMFGIPKVIFGRFGGAVFIDRDGEYGCTEDCGYIAAPVEELEKIKQVLQSEEFQKAAKATYVGGTGSVFDLKFMRALKKDFWK